VLLPSDDVGAGPAVVLLHAGVADRTMWCDHLAALAAGGRRAVAPDLPGFGETPPAAHDGVWLDVLETMDALGVDRAALVGNSFGAAVALRVAVTAPDRVTSLALISPPLATIEPSLTLRAAWAAEEAALDRGDIDAAVSAVLEAWTLPDASQELRDHVARMQRRAFVAQRDAPAPRRVPDPLDSSPAALAGIAVPALAAAGVHDMPDFRAAAESLAATLPAAHHVLIDGAGHLAPLETPDRFRTLLRAFLDQT
jgi:pimeloyl-ACP methyl ester carboxylesterase